MSIISCCQQSETFYLSNKYKHKKHHPHCKTMGQPDGKKNSSGTKVKLPKDDLDRWKEEKAKRMLAWIHTLHGNEHVGAETPWWKVRICRLST